LLIDTAGDADAAEPIAAAAQAAMRAQAGQADLTLVCVDRSNPATTTQPEAPATDSRLVVWTKCDLAAAAEGSRRTDLEVHPTIATSSRTGQGIAELRSAIARALSAAPVESTAVMGTAERCRDSLRLAAESLARAADAARAGLGEELVAAEVRTALDGLGQVVGAVYTEDVLDRVFSRFCIGK
jgi:tRNA modification GTPase